MRAADHRQAGADRLVAVQKTPAGPAEGQGGWRFADRDGSKALGHSAEAPRHGPTCPLVFWLASDKSRDEWKVPTRQAELALAGQSSA